MKHSISIITFLSATLNAQAPIIDYPEFETNAQFSNSKKDLKKFINQSTHFIVGIGGEYGMARYLISKKLEKKGFYVSPTIIEIENLNEVKEEIFGPVLTTLTFRTPDEAVEIANNTEYGLSAGLWTEKGSKILWTADRLDAGVIWANTFNKFDPASPFGGYKESGFGREGGRHGLLSYLKASS